ncbi:hypothetical protein R6Q59_013258 [Mikania micrantha]
MWWNLKGNIRQPLCGCMVLVMMAQGFDVIGISEDSSQDVQGMDASAAYVFSLLSTEPPNTPAQINFSCSVAPASPRSSRPPPLLPAVLTCRLRLRSYAP